MFTIGIDIGGMSIKAGLVDDGGVIVKKITAVTPKTVEEGVEVIANLINELLEKTSTSISQILGIGIGCPGAVDSKAGKIIDLPNLGWAKYPLAKDLEKIFSKKVILSNDANVAVLAEAIYGVAKDYDNVIMFTLGTGVGGGMVLDGKLIEGGWSRGAELGHATLILDGLPCTCGRNGCIERYVSATALIEQTKTEMIKNPKSTMWAYAKDCIDFVDGKTAFECSKQGDESAIKVVNNYVKYLSESILSMLNIFRPEAFVLGGGICNQGDYLVDKVVDYCEKFEYGYPDSPKTKILIASLGNDAGIVGAAALIK